MSGFYRTDPWATEPTLLAGPTTSNLMGLDASTMPTTATTAPSGGMSMGNLGVGLSIMGAITGAIGSFYSAKAQASALKFQSEISSINARAAEQQAQQVLLAGQYQIGRYTMQAGQLKSKQRASMAANGVALGEGNPAEVAASTDIIKELDVFTINSNTVRAASGTRGQATNYANESLTTSAAGGAISPMSAGASSLLTGASSVAATWFRDRKLSALADRLGID